MLRPFLEFRSPSSHFQFFSAIFCYGYDKKEILSFLRQLFPAEKLWLLLINSRTCTINFLFPSQSLLSPQIVESDIPQRMYETFAIEITSLSINFSNSIWGWQRKKKRRKKVFALRPKPKTHLFIKYSEGTESIFPFCLFQLDYKHNTWLRARTNFIKYLYI